MERHSVEAVVQALDAATVRYLIVGGLAVVAHGHLRFTADVDLAIALDHANASRAVRALKSLGYRPRTPVAFEAFADAAQRTSWARERNMTVFSVFSPEHPATEIDLFVELPFDFEKAYRAATHLELAPGVTATFVDRDSLLEMKRKAGRPQDLADIEALTSLDKDV